MATDKENSQLYIKIQNSKQLPLIMMEYSRKSQSAKKEVQIKLKSPSFTRIGNKTEAQNMAPNSELKTRP